MAKTIKTKAKCLWPAAHNQVVLRFGILHWNQTLCLTADPAYLSLSFFGTADGSPSDMRSTDFTVSSLGNGADPVTVPQW
ncbi:hypothetical protein GDO78_017172 [Eleutherodactylus coqui]|uniref:Uncharacterized protein n=1 Tax=Eleutherodactylus coqui TaxID=57060 RepID=A0A8J6E854_ELECQ|nr:hypothetical protein GDO78_017172 [Eleutherodactylus coqui]